MSQSKNWCFTLFEYETVPFVHDLPEWASYIVFQEEECPRTGKSHIQGYVQLVSRLRMQGVKKLFNCNSIHLASSDPTGSWFNT